LKNKNCSILQGKQEIMDILHFWNTPNRKGKQRNTVWKELQSAEDRLIGADNLKDLQ